MSVRYESEIPDLQSVYLRDSEPGTICKWQGNKALKLNGQGPGLLIIPDLRLSQGTIEVEVGAEGAAYAGLAFHIQDTLNYELAYIQPHTSGLWDALQYEPVMHGSNTWQLYYGQQYQQAVETPPNVWHHLRIEFTQTSALIKVNGNPALFVPQLACDHQTGLLGLWTYLPAYFRNLRITDDKPGVITSSGMVDSHPSGMMTEWFMDDYGLVRTENNGILNLNRYISVPQNEIRLTREFELLEDDNINFEFGFSDHLRLQLDDIEIYSGEHLFHTGLVWENRGYVSLNQQVQLKLTKGIHRITAVLEAKEYFGIGLMMKISAENYRLSDPALYS
jgi:hypothetical protein